MIRVSEIEAFTGIKTMLTVQMQQALDDWYSAAIYGEPLTHDPDVKSMGWPAAISSELARLTTLEMELRVTGTPRADWINGKMQRVVSPRRRRVLAVALALGSGVWMPYQTADNLGVSFIPATGYFPVSLGVDGELTEAIFIDQIQDSDGYYNRLQWMHVLTSPQDYHDKERDILEEKHMRPAAQYPCVQVLNLAFRSSQRDALGASSPLNARAEWQGIPPVVYLQKLTKLPVGYFVTPVVNVVDPTSDIGAPMWAPATNQIIAADEQFTRLDWEYEGGELAIDTDFQYLQPGADGEKRSEIPGHRARLFTGLDVNTGISQQTPFFNVFAPALRDNSYLTGLNSYIRQIESHAGLSFGTFSQIAEVERTATEIMSSKQKLYSTVADVQAALEEALRGLIDALDFWADSVPTAPPRGSEMQITFKWDDSILVDRQTEIAQWQQEMTMGVRSRAEYRQHFYGEDEAAALAAIEAVKSELQQADVLKGVTGDADAPTG